VDLDQGAAEGKATLDDALSHYAAGDTLCSALRFGATVAAHGESLFIAFCPLHLVVRGGPWRVLRAQGGVDPR
jgi:hypothetical protein